MRGDWTGRVVMTGCVGLKAGDGKGLRRHEEGGGRELGGGVG